MNSEHNRRVALRADRFGIAQMLLLMAGLAVAFCVMRPLLLEKADNENGDPIQIVPVVLRVVIAVLGGLSLVGVPLLLVRRRRAKRRWGPGQISWFAHGTASWLLWPPILYWQVADRGSAPWSAVCWLWGTPLMGLYVTASLLAGGWLRPRRRRMVRRGWSESFGLLLACAWACTGLYLLGLLYWIDVFKED